MIDDNKYILRNAVVSDIDFIVDVIIEAEKSGSDNCGLANLYDLTTDELKPYLKQILEEEISGCEFSLDSFLVIEYENEPVAAFGGWWEGHTEDNLPSAMIKANLLSYYLPKKCMESARSKIDIVRPFQIEREVDTYQFEYSHVLLGHLGHCLIQWLLEEQENRARIMSSEIKKIQAHVFEHNKAIVLIFKMMGFKITKRLVSDNTETKLFFPDNVLLLMEKEL